MSAPAAGVQAADAVRRNIIDGHRRSRANANAGEAVHWRAHQQENTLQRYLPSACSSRGAAAASEQRLLGRVPRKALAAILGGTAPCLGATPATGHCGTGSVGIAPWGWPPGGCSLGGTRGEDERLRPRWSPAGTLDFRTCSHRTSAVQLREPLRCPLLPPLPSRGCLIPPPDSAS